MNPKSKTAVRRILCPTDFSEFAERALRRSAALASSFGASLTVLHVIPHLPAAFVMPGPLGTGMPAIPQDLLGERREDVEAELERLLAPYTRTGLDVSREIAIGEPWKEIEARARSLEADLVVLGTHGRGGWDRFLLGSTSEKLIRRLPCPALTIGPSDAAPPASRFRRILCALDLTANSADTLTLAYRFAEESVAQVTLLHVIDGDRKEWMTGKGGTRATSAEYARAAREGAIERLYRLGQSAPPLCTVDNLVSRGTAWREIVRIATQTQADLIVIGAHGPGNPGAFLGSTANQVLRHAPAPVLLARAKSEHADKAPGA